jgi:acylphosphatase
MVLNLKAKVHIIVSGRVQRVYFRGYTKNEAQKRNVNGWVRNLPDGRVEAVFEGEKEDIDDLIKSVNEGPSYAKVENLNIKWEDFKGEFTDFQIHY